MAAPFRHGAVTGEAQAEFSQKLGGAKFTKPEADLGWIWSLLVFEIVSLDESADHRPVLVALSFLRLDQVGEREEVA